MAVERDAEHGNCEQEGNVASLLVVVAVSLIDGPDDACYEQEDVDDLSGVERASKHVDKEKLEPSAHLDDAGNHSVEHCGEDDYGHCQCSQ